MRGRSLASALLALVGLFAGGWSPLARPDDGSGPRVVPEGAPFRCTDRLRFPVVADIFEAKWSPDSSKLAVSWYAKMPSARSVAGYHESDTILDTFDVRTGALVPVGVGERPEWSASGRYISYWGPNADELRITRDGRIVAELLATMPDARWVPGDTLLFIERDEIRAWSDGVVRPVARLAREFVPRYPRDDAYFSADGDRFTLTRYSLDGRVERYLGTTATGELTPLDAPGATFTEWAPAGATLLIRYPDRLELRGTDGTSSVVPLTSFAGPTHVWAPDGRAVFVGTVSPTVPGGDALDTFRAFGAPQRDQVATLPNLIGARSFSPNGLYFAGASRTGVAATQLEVYRCGLALGDAESARADTETAGRRSAITGDPRRFVRPAAGPISQFLQGSHTGVDIAAPIGSLVVAADDGTVSETGWIQVGGQRVCVMHAGGLESCYHHTSAALVARGDRVTRGQPVALIGMTGVTTGPHVHWEAKLDGRIVDPLAR